VVAGRTFRNCFLVLTIVVARPLARVNFLFGLFAFALLGGMTYFFAKSAWRGIIEAASKTTSVAAMNAEVNLVTHVGNGSAATHC
jgi:hypothetical protein